MPTINTLSIITSQRCNISCNHCLCFGSGLPDLKEEEHQNIYDIIEFNGIKNIQLTGGEPTLALPILNDFLKRLILRFPNIKIELFTNAHFATSQGNCNNILSQFGNPYKIIISYDESHAKFIPLFNITNLIHYCKSRNILVQGFATIASPIDLIKIYNYEKEFGISFKWQRILPIGKAIKNRSYYKYERFEKGVLSQKCPQLKNFIYIPGYGITHCCSSIWFKSDDHQRRKIARQNIQEYIHTDFFKKLSKNKFKQLIEIAGVNIRNLDPCCSSVCELCYRISPLLLENN